MSGEAGPFVPRLRLSAVAVVCCLLTIFAVAVKPVADPDFWWHLATGRYITAVHAIPHHDVFSLTARSHVWITHEWLTEILFYGGWNLGGTRLLMLVTACAITATFAIVYLAARERGASAYLSAALVLLAALASAHTWGTRPQMLSLLFTALYGLALSRMVVRRQSAPPWWVPLLMILWVNIHGGFIFGVALVAVTTTAYVVQDRYAWLRSVVAAASQPAAQVVVQSPIADLRRCTVVVLCTALATLLNPNGLAGALYPFSYLGNNASTRYIAEWVSPNFHQAQYLLFEALILILLVAAWAGRRSARLADIAIVVPFLILSLQSVRNISLYAVLATPITAEVVHASLPLWLRRERAMSRVPRGKSLINWVAAIAIGTGIAASAGAKLTGSSQAHAIATTYPAGAIRYMATHNIPARGFDSYNWGGYLIWRWYGGRSVYVDGRPDMYGDTFMDRYMRAYSGDDTWVALFRDDHLCYALIEPDSGIARVLRRAPGWKLAYHDAVAQLFVVADQRRGCSE